MPRALAIASSLSIAGMLPYRSTKITAFVRSVIAASKESGRMHQVASSTSTNTGVAPTYDIGAADAIHVLSGMMTSSPGPTPSAIRLR